MARYRIFNANDKIVVDGQTITQGQTVAIIETELPLGNVFSGAFYGNFANEPIADALKVAVVAREVGLDAKPKAIDAEPVDVVDPDELNEADLAADADEAADTDDDLGPPTDAPATPAADQPAAAVVDANAPIDPSLDGLTERVQRVLTLEGLGTRDKIAAFVANGDKLVDLEGIGPAAELKILAWLGN